MFITEQQLCEYKFTKGSKYYNQKCADIVQSEFFNFAQNVKIKHEDVLSFFEHFLHRRLDSTNFLYYFNDDSVLRIEEIEKDGEKTYCFYAVFSSFDFDQ